MEHWGPCCLLPCWPIVMHLRYDIIISGMAQERSCPRFYNTHTHICFREENIFYGFLICLSVFFFFWIFCFVLGAQFLFSEIEVKRCLPREEKPTLILPFYLFIYLGFFISWARLFPSLTQKKKKRCVHLIEFRRWGDK